MKDRGAELTREKYRVLLVRAKRKIGKREREKERERERKRERVCVFIRENEREREEEGLSRSFTGENGYATSVCRAVKPTFVVGVHYECRKRSCIPARERDEEAECGRNAEGLIMRGGPGI